MRTTMLAVLMLMPTTGAHAQGERELEFGGGFHVWNELQGPASSRCPERADWAFRIDDAQVSFEAGDDTLP